MEPSLTDLAHARVHRAERLRTDEPPSRADVVARHAYAVPQVQETPLAYREDSRDARW